MNEILFSLVSYSLGKEFPPENPNNDPKKLGITGILVTISSLSVLFITSLIGFFWVKSAAITKGTWIPVGIPKIPFELVISTSLILVSSFSFHLSLKFFQEKKFSNYKISFLITYSLAILFILFQILAWKKMFDLNLKPTTPNLFSFIFYFLTSLHILHVLFGIIPMTKILKKIFQLDTSTQQGNRLVISAIYWHFLDAVWLVLFSVLYFY